jgi:alpha-beta hydrolase superfamily lysophospholipase
MRAGAVHLATALLLPACLAAAADPLPAAAGKENAPQELLLEASDGATIAAWYYPLPKDAASLGTVILIHDIDGSHRTVEPLAKALQAAGCAVVAPDLRGHGASVMKAGPTGPAPESQAKSLRKTDFEIMAAATGGSVREQADVRGDLECVYEWIRQQAAKEKLQMKPLVVVGAGAGATVAARWAAADAAWPPIASGPQGRQVGGVVLIGPAFVSKGFSIQPALSQELLGRSPPVLVLSGSDDRDAVRIFDQIKRHRPREAFDERKGAAANGEAADKPTLFLLKVPVNRSGDALACYRSTDPKNPHDAASRIIGFMTKVLNVAL